MTIKVKDYWLWHQVRLSQEHCDKCRTGDSITVKKKDIKKLIKILKKLDYKGLPSGGLRFKDKEFEIKEEKWQWDI